MRDARTGAGAAVAALVVAVGVLAWAALDPESRTRPPERPVAVTAATAPSTLRASAPGGRALFVPPVRRERGRRVMPLRFPDGSTAELVVASTLDLAAMGVQPDVSFLRLGQPAHRYPITFWFGQPDAEALEGDRPVERYATRGGGQAELWRARTASSSFPEQRWWVTYRLASWTVLAPASTPATAADVAGHLDVREAGDGYPVVQARTPFALARESGEGGGPQLAVGDRSPWPHLVDAGTRFRLVTLRPARTCLGEGGSPSRKYAALCLGRAGNGAAVFAGVDGDRAFVKAVVAGLAARKVKAGPVR
jgi:hypothetical protein